MQVCTTELGTVAKYQEEFTKRNVKVFALSCNDVESHKKWIVDVEAAGWSNGKKVSKSSHHASTNHSC